MSNDIRLTFENLRIDPPGTEITSQALAFTNIEADVRVYLGGRLFLDAILLTVVEFAGVLNGWLVSGETDLTDFRFESSDDEDRNILSFGVSGQGLLMSSGWQQFGADHAIDSEQAVAELRRFVEEVVERCQAKLGLDVAGWVGEKAD